MSLFERLNNKRHNLHEESKDPLDKFDAYDNLDQGEQKKLKQTKKIVRKQIEDEGDKISSSKRYPDATSGGKTKKLSTTTTWCKIQKSVDAKVITKKYNERNPNRPEYVKPKEYKAAETITKQVNKNQQRPLGSLVKRTKPSSTAISGKLTPGQIDFSKAGELASKRKARIDPKTGKATQAGVFDFAKNRGGFTRMSKGMSKSDFKKMITSDPKKASQFKKIVTRAKTIASDPSSKEYKKIADNINKSDYAGRFARRGKTSRMNASQKAAEIARIKAGIEARDAAKGRYRKPRTVLKVTQPGSKFRASKLNPGFDVVPTSDPVGKEILKKMDTTGFVPPKPPVKKPSLFKRVIKKVFDPEGWKIPKKDWDLKTIRGPKGAAISQTRRSFKPLGKGFLGIEGPVRKTLAKLPLRYKLIGGTALALTNKGIRKNVKKALLNPKSFFVSKPPKKPEIYDVVNKPIGFNTGRVNAAKKRYKQDLKKLNPERFKKEFNPSKGNTAFRYNPDTGKTTKRQIK